MKEIDVTEFKAVFDCRETLFNQFVVVFKDQNEELTLFKQADTAFTVKEVFASYLLTFSANKDTFFTHVFILTRDDETVLNELYVVQ